MLTAACPQQIESVLLGFGWPCTPVCMCGWVGVWVPLTAACPQQIESVLLGFG